MVPVWYLTPWDVKTAWVYRPVYRSWWRFFTDITCHKISHYIKHVLQFIDTGTQQLEIINIWYFTIIVIVNIATNNSPLKSKTKLIYINAEQNGREDTALLHSVMYIYAYIFHKIIIMLSLKDITVFRDYGKVTFNVLIAKFYCIASKHLT